MISYGSQPATVALCICEYRGSVKAAIVVTSPHSLCDMHEIVPRKSALHSDFQQGV